MRKEINAKFTSRCSACGSDIHPGDLITYDPAVKYSSRHKVCPATVVKSKVALNSPGRTALQGRGRGDFFLGEKTEIVRSFALDYKPDQSDLGGTIHATKGAEAGQYLTCVGAAAHWVSQNEADDFDLVGPRGGFSSHWSVMRYYRPATDEEAAACQQREAAKAAKKRFDELCDYTRTLYPQAESFDTDKIRDLAERVRVWKKTVGYSGHEAYRCELGLVTYHPVYDDSPYSHLVRWADLTPEDAEVLRNAPEVK